MDIGSYMAKGSYVAMERVPYDILTSDVYKGFQPLLVFTGTT